MLHLCDRIDRDVARTGDDHPLAIEALVATRQHALDEIDRAIAGRLGAHAGAAPRQPLARQHARLVTIGHALVLAEHVADLALPDADVAGGDVGIFAEMPIQFGHEGLAEAHDLVVGAALRIEIRSTLAAADRHARQRVLEGLLEAEELDGAEKDARMESQATLERTERRIELHAKATVDLHLPPVVDPRYAEDDLALRLADTFDQRAFGIIRMFRHNSSEAVENFMDGLVKFDFPGVAAQNVGVDRLQLFIEHQFGPSLSCLIACDEVLRSAGRDVRRHLGAGCAVVPKGWAMHN